MSSKLTRRYRVLLVDDDPGLLRLLTIRLKSEGYEVAACESASQALAAVPRFKPDCVVTDLRMSEQDGIGLLKDLQRRHPALPVVLMTAHGTIPDAVEATRSGAFAFLTKPIEKEELLKQIRKAMSVSGFAAGSEDWRAGIVTRNPVVESRLEQALVAASSDVTVLITGQPGTGKSQLAHAIHAASARRGARLVTLPCADATSEGLEAAWHGRRQINEPPPKMPVPAGSLFLEEVADLSLSLQAQLMDRLATSGSDIPRIMASSSRSLPQQVARGQFREDLYYRLAVTRLDLPPLSQRREDIPLLAAHFLDRLATPHKPKPVMSPEAMEALISAEWPGNIRQLEGVIAESSSLARSPVISAEVIREVLGGATATVPPFDTARDEFTRSYLAQLMQVTRGNVTQAAKLAGRNRTDFYKLLNRHNIAPDSFKSR